MFLPLKKFLAKKPAEKEKKNIINNILFLYIVKHCFYLKLNSKD